jgi:hypothetical protein
MESVVGEVGERMWMPRHRVLAGTQCGPTRALKTGTSLKNLANVTTIIIQPISHVAQFAAEKSGFQVGNAVSVHTQERSDAMQFARGIKHFIKTGCRWACMACAFTELPLQGFLSASVIDMSGSKQL